MPAWARHLSALKVDLHIAELADSAVFTPGLFWNLLRYSPDVVVLEDLGGMLNSLSGALYCRLWKRPYLIWGLGNVPNKRRSRLRTVLAPLIGFLYGGAFGFICYSKHAAKIYSNYGKPTYLAPNSSLPRPTATEIALVERAINERYDDQDLRIISIGVLKPQKRFDVLIRAMAQMPDNVSLDLVGDGPELSMLKNLASSLGVSERIRFHGALYDAEKKSALLLSAHIGVMPGRGGLAIQEMMKFGLPVITGAADGTESDMVVDGENGYLVDGFLTSETIRGKLADFLALTLKERAAMASAALEVTVQTSNIGTMASGFVAAIEDALAATRADNFERCTR